MISTIFFFLGYTIGFGLSSLLYGRGVGEIGILPNIRFQIADFYISPHHWMYFLVLTFFVAFLHHKQTLFSENQFRILVGFCIGGFIQGLSYKDCLNVVTRL